MHERFWPRRIRSVTWRRDGGGRNTRRWLVERIALPVVALVMVATAVLWALGPLGVRTVHAQSACAYNPLNRPTLSVDNSAFTLFQTGQTITIRGSGYHCSAQFTVMVTPEGVTSTPYPLQVTTDATGSFQTPYTIPAGGLTSSPYPITVQIYDVYATLQANLTLHSCQEAGMNTNPLHACGPASLIQDAGSYSTLQPLEQNAEQQIASLRGIANDTTNVYFSRGEIRAQMFVDLLAKINACGSHSSTCSASDQAIVAYYANAVKQERVDVAQLADNLFEATSSFCIPGTTSCGWQSWKSNSCDFLVPLGLGAQTGPNQSDSAQLVYENTVCQGPPNPYYSPPQPSFNDFTTWAAAAMFGSQIEQWATGLMAQDPSYTTRASALAQVQQEYIAATDGFQEGDQYLTLKHAQIPNLSSPTAAEQNLQAQWLEGFGGFARDQMTDLVKTEVSSIVEALVQELATELPELSGTAETLVPLLITAVVTTAVGLYLTITDSQLSCTLQSALSAAQSDNLYSDINGNTSYTYSGSSCPSGSVTMSASEGDALALNALMASTMPDFTNLRNQASYAGVGPAQPSDPIFVTNYLPYTSTNTIGVKTWSGLPAEVSVVNGWFSVSGKYQPALEYQAGGALYRSWIDGNNIDTYFVGYPLGQVTVQDTINGGCPGLMPPGIPTVQPGLCVVPAPAGTHNFQGTPPITGQSGVVYDIAIGTMTGEEGAVTQYGSNSHVMIGGAPGIESAQIRQATAFADYSLLTGSQGITLATPATNGSYSAAYLLTDPEPSCFTSSPFGSSATPECIVLPSLRYDDLSASRLDGATLHRVGAADDSFTVNTAGQVTGGVLSNDAPTSRDINTLTQDDVPQGNTQVSVAAGVSNGQLNLNVSTPPFSTSGNFTYTANPGFSANAGSPSCQPFPIPGIPTTTYAGYTVCGGSTATAADSFIYKLCYTVANGVDGGSAPTVCTYARAAIQGIPQVLTFPNPGTKTYGDPAFSNPATSTGPGVISYATGAGSVGCSIDQSGEVTITGAAVGSNYCILTASQAGSGGYIAAAPVTVKFHIAQAPIAVTASHADLTYGDATPGASSYTYSYSGFKLSDTQASVIGSAAPACVTNYQQGNDTGGYAINCAIGTLSSPNYAFVSGYTGSNGFTGTSGTALSSAPVQLGAFNVAPATLTVTPAKPPTVQYSDPAPSLDSSVSGFVLGQNSSIFTTPPTCSTSAATASFSNAAGTVTTTRGVNSPAGTYSVTCSGGTLAPAYASDYQIKYGSTTMNVTQENAQVEVTGSQAAVPLPTTGPATDTLTATVWDSAAANGYTGANAESGSTATIGDVTRMNIEFDIYQAGSCLSGTPAYTPVVPVTATGTPGVGTATYTFSQSMPGAFCVVPRIVGATAGSVNEFYTAPDGQVAGISFYLPNGQFVTGGGWVPDSGSSNGHGNFGFEAHYNTNGSPKGQFVYVWRGTYNGQAVDFIIKSNALASLSISQLGPTTYQATLQGKCSYTIVSQATGQQLYGEGNDTFIATVVDGDNGLSQQTASSDSLELATFESGNVQLHPIATTPLSRGDVVIHN